MAIGRLTQQYLCTTALGMFQLTLAPDIGGATPPSRKVKKSSRYLTLEPRMMFDGAMAATASEVAHDVLDFRDVARSDILVVDRDLFNALAATPDPASAAESAPLHAPLVYLPSDENMAIVASHDVVFIDSAVANPGVIVAAVPAGAEIVYLDAAHDGLDQIAEYLNGRSGLSAIHIISHGNEAQLILGSTTINSANLAAHANDLVVIKSALVEHGDILLYGCDVAKGTDGAAFVAAIAAATGDDVAASTDLTGSADLGGNWVLEDRIGIIDAAIIDARDWHGILAPLNIAVTAAPTITGIFGTDPTTGLPITGVGGTALWSNAGFVGTTAIDLKATVVSTTTSGMAFISQGDDASIVLTSAGDVVIKWEIFAAGTNILAVGSPNFNIVDVDGAGGAANSREIVIPQLNGLTAYTLETVTHEVASVSASGVNVSGTQNETANPPVSISQVQFSWQNVSSWTVKYSLNGAAGFNNAVFRHDGNGSFTFTAPNTVSLLSLDLDVNNSAAPGTAYQATYPATGSAISIADLDIKINQNSVLGANLGKATVVLTNAQLGDVLSVGTLPAGISAVIDTSVAGKVRVTVSGNANITDYQLALQAVTFKNTNQSPSAVDRVLNVNVTNTVFGTTSADAVATIHVTLPQPIINTLPTGWTTLEETTIPLTGLSVADADVGATTVNVILDIPAFVGKLTAIGTGTVTVIGSGSNHLILTGTLANINTFLSANTPNFAPDVNFNGTIPLTMTSTELSAATPISLPTIEGAPAFGVAATGWTIGDETPDIIAGNGAWPGGAGYVVSDVSGLSPQGGTMGLFLNNGTNTFPTALGETWKTPLTGLTVGQSYSVSVNWQQATLAGGATYSGGQLKMIVDGVETVFTGTGTPSTDDWQTAIVTFVATSTTANFEMGMKVSATNGAIVIDSGAFLSPAVDIDQRNIVVTPVNDAPEVAIVIINPGDVFVVDAATPNAQSLIDTLPAGSNIIIIPIGVDGVTYLAAQLAGQNNISNLHILSHGEVSVLHLGTASLNAANISTTYSAAFASIGASLKSNSDILIYGCDFGQNVSAMSALATATGADIAASTDKTGDSALGGDWILENTIGLVETSAISPLGWHSLLAPIQVVAGQHDAPILMHIDVSKYTAGPITIGNVPIGAVLSSGVNNNDGTWTVPLANLATLAITPPPGFAGLMSGITVTGTNPPTVVPSTITSPIKLIFAYSPEKEIDVWSGNGDGTFKDPRHTSLVNSPLAGFGSDVARRTMVGDTNGDGISDVIYTDDLTHSISVYKGKIDGTFAPNPITTVVNTNIGLNYFGTDIASETMFADVDGDGKKDIVFADSLTGKLSTYKGNGDGTFAAAPIITTVTTTPFLSPFGTSTTKSTQLADVNGDGRADLVYETIGFSQPQFGVWLGQATGGFATTAVVTNATGSTLNQIGTDVARSTLVADVNGDGRADIVFADELNNKVMTWTGTASGGFNAAAIVTTFANPIGTFGQDVAQKTMLTDVTGDGKADLVFAYEFSKSVSVFAGTGTGTFATTAIVSTIDLGVGGVGIDTLQDTFLVVDKPDTDKDGILDAVDPDLNGDGIADATQPLATVLGNPVSPAGLVSVYGGSLNPSFSTWTSNTGGTFDTDRVTTHPTSGGVSGGSDTTRETMLADTNGDGIDDIITAYEFDGKIRTYLGKADGSFATIPIETATGSTTPVFGTDIVQSTRVADVNGDGKVDIVYTNGTTNTARTWLGNGNGSFSATAVVTNVAAGSGSLGNTAQQKTEVIDTNGDGRADIVVANDVDGTIKTFLGNADGSFATTAITTTIPGGPGRFGTGIAQETMMGDVSGDGIADIVYVSALTHKVTVWDGIGDGTFATTAVVTPITTTLAGIGSGTLVKALMGDVTGDGKADLVFVNNTGALVEVWAGNGNNTFSAVAPVITPVAQNSVTTFGQDTLNQTMLGRLGGGATPGVVTQTINFNVIAGNLAPVATVPTYMTAEDATKVLTGISFSDPDAGAANVTVTLSVAHGTLDINTTVVGGITAAQITGDLSGTITITASLAAINATLVNATGLTYTPTLNYNGTDVLNVAINDNGNTGAGGPLTALTAANIVVTPVNDPPTDGNETNSTLEDTPVVVLAASGLLANSVDPDGGSPSITGFTVFGVPGTPVIGTAFNIPGKGDIIINADGSYTFTPALNYNGAVPQITYTISDGAGETDTSTLDLSVTAVNDIPLIDLNSSATTSDTAVNNAITFTEGDAAVKVALISADVNDIGENDITKLTIVAGANPDGTAEKIVIGGVAFDLATTLASQPATIGGTNVLISYNATTKTFTVVNAAGATVPLAQADLDTLVRGVTYENTSQNPTAGTQTLTFTATDASNATSPSAAATITIVAVNDAPVDSDEINSTLEDTTLVVAAVSGLLANSVDPDGGTPTITGFTVAGVVGTPVIGTAFTIAGKGDITINADGSYTFAPASNYNGPIPQITYTVSDGAGGTDTSTFDLSVTAVNDTPLIDLNSAATTADVTRGNAVTFTEGDTPISVALISADVNDIAENDITKLTIVAGANPDGTAEKLVIGGVAFDLATTLASQPATIGGTNVLISYDATTKIFTVVNAAGAALPMAQADLDTLVRGVTYENTSQNPTTGTQTLTFTATDASNVTSPPAVATITIVAVNDPPVDGNEINTVTEDVPLIVPAATGLLANVVDPDGGTPTITGFTVAGVVGTPVVGTPFTITGKGDITINADGSYTFAPALNYNGPVPLITYTVSDGAGGTDTSTLDLSVITMNDDPVDGNELANVTEDVPLIVTAATGLLLNSTDVDGGAPSITGYTIDGIVGVQSLGVAHTIAGVGDITINADGSYTFAPALNYAGAVPVITYTIIDGAGGTDTSTLTLTMIAVNDPPVDGNETADVTEDTPLIVSAAAGLFLNSTDVDGGAPMITGFTIAGIVGAQSPGAPVTIPGVGNITINADGSYSFAPALNYFGPVPVITYTIDDGAGGTDTSTLALVMIAVDDVPLIDLNSAATAADMARNNIVTFTEGDAPIKVATLIADVNDAGENDITKLTIVAGSNPDGTNEKVVIGGVVFDLATTLASQPATIGSTNLLISYAATTKTFTVVNAAGATVPMAQADLDMLIQNVTYENTSQNPTAGARTLTFTATDLANQVSPPAVATVNIVPVNDPPVDDNEIAVATEDTPLVVTAASGLLANSTDVDGGTPTIIGFAVPGLAGTQAIGTAITIPSVGDITINADGSYTFAPVPNYAGAVPVITYTVDDGAGGTDTSTLSLSITPINDAPVVIDPANPGTPLNPVQAPDAANIIPDISTTDGATPTNPNVAQYFVDPEGDTLTFSAMDLPTGLIMNSDGTIVGTITPNASQGGNVPGSPGVYLVTVAANDGHGGVTTTTITYTVTNPPPVAVDDSKAVIEDTPTSGNVLTNGTPDHDTAPDSDPLVVTQFTIIGIAGTFMAGATATIPNVGTLKIDANGAYTFTPAPNYDGPVPIATYTISDGNGGTDTGDLIITITPVNDAPVVIDPANPGTPLNPIPATDPNNIIPDVTTTDGAVPAPINAALYFVDPEGDLLVFTATGLPPGLTILPNGTIFGTIDAAASQGASPGQPPGTYLVTITADDGNGHPVNTTVTYTISNLTPIAVNDNSVGDEDHQQAGTVLTNDHDVGPDTDPLSVVAVNGSPLGAPVLLTYGTLTMDSTGSWTFTPNALAQTLQVGITVTEQVTYKISDGNGGFADATLTIAVEGVNDAPISVPLPPANALEGSPITIPTSHVFKDVDSGDVLSFTASGLPPGLMINPITGVISGTPAGGSSADGPYTVIVQVDDGHGGIISSVFILDVKLLAGVTSELPIQPPLNSLLDHPALPPVSHDILDTVSLLDKPVGILPELDDHIISRTLQSLGNTNSLSYLDDGEDKIHRLVQWLSRQGKSNAWISGLLDKLEQTPYAGDALSLNLSLGGNNQFAVRTLIHDGAMFIGVDEMVPGAVVLSITGDGQRGLPSFAAKLGGQDLVINVPPTGGLVYLVIKGRTPDGQITNWTVSVDMQSGEVKVITKLPKHSELPMPIKRVRAVALNTSDQLSRKSSG